MFKALVAASFLSSLSFASITWNTPENVTIPSTAQSQAISTSVDNAGNAIAYFANVIGETLSPQAYIHLADGSSWGSLITGIGSDSCIPMSSFPGATGNFVVAYLDGIEIKSQTISTGGAVGIAKLAGESGEGVDFSNFNVASNPSGNAILIYLETPNADTEVQFKIYTGTSDVGEENPWSGLASISIGNTIAYQRAAADAGGNYGIALITAEGEGRAGFKIGNASFSNMETPFDTGIQQGMLAIAAQVQATDTDGMFLIAYEKSGIIYAQLKAAGSSTSLSNKGNISGSAGTIGSVVAAMNKSGDGVVAWNDDGIIYAAKYTASTDSFAAPVEVATGLGTLQTASSDSNGNIHLFYSRDTGNYSITLASGATTWGDAVLIRENSAEIESFAATTNPRSTKASALWSFSSSSLYAAFGNSSSSGDNHGAAGSLFRKNKSGLRPGRRPFR